MWNHLKTYIYRAKVGNSIIAGDLDAVTIKEAARLIKNKYPNLGELSIKEQS